MNNLYLIEADFGRIGKAFIETDRDLNSRAKVIDLIRSGEVRPVKIIEICEDDGWVRDVTLDIMEEVARQLADINPAAAELFTIDAIDHARDYRKQGE
jgi:hypothetical protein